ncbi:unnamed protein product [Knipowitschia caucasica]
MHSILLTAGFFLLWASMVSCNRLVCYYNSEAATRGPGGQLLPANIDPNLCTHIIFGFASVDNTKELVPTQASDTTLYTALNSLKSSNAQLKTLLAVGGPGFNTQKFSTMVASSNSRSRFIASAISLLQTYNFDGLNLDWRYPGDASTQPQDKNRFVFLCQELRTAFNAASPRLLLSASVSAEKTMIVNSYPTPVALANALDFINVLTFGFHDPSSAVTAHHSPLGALSSNAADTKTTEYAMNYWASDLGVPAAKLNMGIAAYGVAFTLTDPSVSGPGAATSGPAEEGCFGNPPGIWSYYEVCLYTETDQLIADQSVPYAVSEGQWVGFDNTASIDAKVAHITTNGYGGVCVVSLDLDDFAGRFCSAGNYPFINYLKSKL